MGVQERKRIQKANQRERSNTNIYLHLFDICKDVNDMRYGETLEANDAHTFQTIDLQFSIHILLLLFLDSFILKQRLHRFSISQTFNFHTLA